MKKLIISLFIIFSIPNILNNNYKTNANFSVENLSSYQKTYIAHSGGAISGNTYTNCYNSIKNSYDLGIRLMELDIEFTKDDIPVMIHSWDGFQYKYLGIQRDIIPTFEEFMNATMINGYTQLSLESTIDYMKSDFKEMFLITDTKNDNKKLLSLIKENYSDIQDRIIPQVYNQSEYFYAQNLGYKNIIYTLYMSPDSDDEIIDFCKNNNVFAITMPKARALSSDIANRLKEINVFVYAHTVDNQSEFDELKTKGVSGIYTNELFN